MAYDANMYKWYAAQLDIRFQAYLWLSLAVFCGFVMWDTQVIMEKRRRGDGDFIGHSLDLFIDFVQIFRKVLIILMQKVSLKSNFEIIMRVLMEKLFRFAAGKEGEG